MNPFFSLVKLLLKAAIFFTLFAFALNNQADVTVHFFFGYQWTSPLVMVVHIGHGAALVAATARRQARPKRARCQRQCSAPQQVRR